MFYNAPALVDDFIVDKTEWLTQWCKDLSKGGEPSSIGRVEVVVTAHGETKIEVNHNINKRFAANYEVAPWEYNFNALIDFVDSFASGNFKKAQKDIELAFDPSQMKNTVQIVKKVRSPLGLAATNYEKSFFDIDCPFRTCLNVGKKCYLLNPSVGTLKRAHEVGYQKKVFVTAASDTHKRDSEESIRDYVQSLWDVIGDIGFKKRVVVCKWDELPKSNQAVFYCGFNVGKAIENRIRNVIGFQLNPAVAAIKGFCFDGVFKVDKGYRLTYDRKDYVVKEFYSNLQKGRIDNDIVADHLRKSSCWRSGDYDGIYDMVDTVGLMQRKYRTRCLRKTHFSTVGAYYTDVGYSMGVMVTNEYRGKAMPRDGDVATRYVLGSNKEFLYKSHPGIFTHNNLLDILKDDVRILYRETRESFLEMLLNLKHEFHADNVVPWMNKRTSKSMFAMSRFFSDVVDLHDGTVRCDIKEAVANFMVLNTEQEAHLDQVFSEVESYSEHDKTAIVIEYAQCVQSDFAHIGKYMFVRGVIDTIVNIRTHVILHNCLFGTTGVSTYLGVLGMGDGRIRHTNHGFLRARVKIDDSYVIVRYDFSNFVPVVQQGSVDLLDYIATPNFNCHTWAHVIGTQIRIDLRDGIFFDSIE